MAKKAKGKPHADRNPKRPVQVSAMVAEGAAGTTETASGEVDQSAGAAGTLPDVGAAPDHGGQPAADAARGQLGEDAAAGPEGPAAPPADQAPASTDDPAADVRPDAGANGENPAAAGAVAPAETEAAAGSVADAAEEPELTPAQLLGLGSLFAAEHLMCAVVGALPYSLPLLMLATAEGTEADLIAFLDGFPDPSSWANEAHNLITGHADLPPDAFWLHMTARELLPKTAETFAGLPAWQRRAFSMLIRSYEAQWAAVRAAIDAQAEILRAEEQAQQPPRRVKLSDTIFEKHDRIDALVDGLRVNPRH